MSFRWLKPYMPGSLYGRAILILLLPVVTVTLVVSVVFIQRHFDGVTTQMTNSVSREVRLMLDSGLAPEELARSQMAQTLLIAVEQVSAEDVPESDSWRWYDFTGAIVAREMRRWLPRLLSVQLPDDQNVQLYLLHEAGPIEMSFDRRRVSASNPHQLLVNMVFFAILMTVIAYVYLRNQLRPITRLARAAEAFGRGRRLEYRPAGAVEVKAAGRAFLEMRDRIDRQIEQRTLMLSGVSHDLRTPLTRLKLGLSLIDSGDREAMKRDVSDMERLITEFLDFARGAHQGEMESLDPVALVRQIVEDADRSGNDVSLVLTEGEGTTSLRRDAVRRAIENLINNAVRYGTKAEVSVLLTDDTLRIRVEDDGPGIPETDREQALKPFARLDSARNQNLGSGVGLGLSIAMDIARGHGGSIRLGDSARLGGLRADFVVAR
jgi:two-component system osmolarity sensor histidine kinase EnvZ